MKILLLTFGLYVGLPMMLCHADLTKAINPNKNVSTLQSPLQLNITNEQQVITLTPISVKEETLNEIKRIKKQSSSYKDFLTYSSAKEFSTKKRIPLVKANTTRSKRAFTFIFMMNKPKTAPVEKTVELAKNRKHLHIMWTGSKKKMQEQKIVENEYPVDISIDNYSEGYAPGEWNLALPNKKPREVSVALLWTF